MGELPFRFSPLGALRGARPAAAVPDLEPPHAAEILSTSREYEADIFALFRAVADLDYRHRWQDGVRRVDYARDVLPRVGMTSVQIRDDGQTAVYASGFTLLPDRIVLRETDEDRTRSRVFTAERITADRARLTIAFQARTAPGSEVWVSPAEKRAMEIELHQSRSNLDGLVAELRALTSIICITHSKAPR